MYTTFQREEAITIVEESADFKVKQINEHIMILTHSPFDVYLPIQFINNEPTITIESFCQLFETIMGGEGQPMFDANGDWKFILHKDIY